MKDEGFGMQGILRGLSGLQRLGVVQHVRLYGLGFTGGLGFRAQTL